MMKRSLGGFAYGQLRRETPNFESQLRSVLDPGWLCVTVRPIGVASDVFEAFIAADGVKSRGTSV